MKRSLLVILAGFLINAYIFAQWEDDPYDSAYDSGYGSSYDSGTSGDSDYSGYDQPGTGDSGQTDITVKNTGTEEQSEQKLTLPNNQPIYLYFYNNVQNPVPPEPQPKEEKSETPPESVYIPPPFIEERYNPPPPPPAVEYRYVPYPPVEYMYVPTPPPAVEYRYIPTPPPEPMYLPPPLNVRVIPSLPDPNSPKIYRIQVGAYSVHSTADRIAQQLRAAGLQAGVEYYNSLLRVYVQGVRASDACSVVQKLGTLGFQEVWIRE